MATKSETKSTENAVKKLLATVKVGSLPVAKGKVIVVKGSQTPYEGFKALVDNNVLSVPVYDPTTKKYTGFLDIKDLVSFVVFVDDDQKSDVPQNLHELIMHGCKLFKVPLDGVTVTYLSRRNQLHPVSPSSSLLDVCEILASGVHRVPVMDNGEIVNIVSQSSIIQFLQQHHKELAPLTSKKISEIKIGSKPVVTVNKSTPAIDAFRLMDNKKISGLAVVDEGGRFVGNTSASDLKLFMQTLSLEILKQPISQFLNTLRQESIDIRVPTISVTSHDTVQTVISKLASTKIHKLFVADDSDGYKPKLVISITDILKYLLNQ